MRWGDADADYQKSQYQRSLVISFATEDALSGSQLSPEGTCKTQSDACLGCVEGGGEDGGEDDGGCDNDGCDNDGCESFQALFESLPPQLTAVVGARLRPRLPAVSDLPRGSLNASVRASKACGKGNTLLESASMRPALIALAFIYCLASADLISVGLTPL